MKKSLFMMHITLLSGCMQNRPETPDFFTGKTNIIICNDTVLKNKQVSRYDSEFDFVYSVNILINKKCNILLYKQIYKAHGIDCDNLNECSFMDSRVWSYKILKRSNGSVDFTMQAI